MVHKRQHGVAFNGDGADSVDTALRNADVAMYVAKKHGRGQFAVFEPAMHEAVLARLALEERSRVAIERDELIWFTSRRSTSSAPSSSA